jgi:hypothetical protein
MTLLNLKWNQFVRIYFRAVIPFVFLIYPETCFGQKPRHKILLAAGYYEGLQIGYDRIAASGKFRWQAGLGFEKYLVKDQSTWSASFNAGTPVFRKFQDSEGNHRWYVMGKLIFWQMTDPYYDWNALSVCPAICRDIHISGRHFLMADLGPSIQFVLHSKRKTKQEIGWPYAVLPNLRISYCF